MKSNFHDDVFFKDLLKAFVKDLPQASTQISAALAADDLTEVRDLAHQFAGSSATYGYPVLAKAFAGLENAVIRGEDSATCAESLLVVKDIIEQVLGAF